MNTLLLFCRGLLHWAVRTLVYRAVCISVATSLIDCTNDYITTTLKLIFQQSPTHHRVLRNQSVNQIPICRIITYQPFSSPGVSFGPLLRHLSVLLEYPLGHCCATFQFYWSIHLAIVAPPFSSTRVFIESLLRHLSVLLEYSLGHCCATFQFY